MDFAWSPEQVELRKSVVDFGRTLQKDDDLPQRDRNATFSRELWTRCAEFGIQGLPFPERYGGSGLDVLTTVMAMEALGYGCADSGLNFSIAAQMWSVQMPILRFGSDLQREKYLTPLCTGESIGAHGMSEPDSGSDAFSLRTSARRDGDHYVLNGTKMFVSNAPVADLFVVFATVDARQGIMGITGFVVEKAFPGVRVSRPIEKLGLRTSPMAEVILEDCRVPVENRLGREGRGGMVFNDSMEWERTCILAGVVGRMDRQLEGCIRYARERKQFGRSIGGFQSVSNKLVAMRLRIETARLLLYQAAWLRDQGDATGSSGMMAAMAKLHVSEAALQSGLDAVQIHGGYGYMEEYPAARELRDAVGGTLYSGTSEIQQGIVARHLGLESI
jgi:alkylation response protein AidB-like acyl-CoA dehydrogenase